MIVSGILGILVLIKMQFVGFDLSGGVEGRSSVGRILNITKFGLFTEKSKFNSFCDLNKYLEAVHEPGNTSKMANHLLFCYDYGVDNNEEVDPEQLP